jgi:hypothetical protein
VVFVGLEKRAPNWPLVTKGHFIYSSCDSEGKLLTDRNEENKFIYTLSGCATSILADGEYLLVLLFLM